jgi:predicted nucleic acid-binding protein
MKTWLLDTGPLVAFLDARDDAHDACVSCLGPFRGQLWTTSAVITESMHMVSDVRDGASLMAELVLATGALVQECAQPAQLKQAAALMATYPNVPMDFADATLVLLAEEIGVHHIVTLDRRGFSAYRTRKRKSFRLVLDEHE